jgi:hypothetical protein
MPFTDCLVLKIVEINDSDKCVDNMVYVFYDTNQQLYEIRGKVMSKSIPYETYSFRSELSKDVERFIKLIVDKNTVTYDLLNYKELPLTSEEITFEYLENEQSDKNEIVSFFPSLYSSSKVKHMLKTIKYVFNEYA